jgi:hypothetical protein
VELRGTALAVTALMRNGVPSPSLTTIGLTSLILLLVGCHAPSAADDRIADDGGVATAVDAMPADASSAEDASPHADAAATHPPDAGAPPSFDSIPWQTGANVGNGVAKKDTGNPLGDNVFIGYAGYNVTLAAAEAWVGALYHASLSARGVRWVYAVQGPADAGYDGLEIGNSKIAAALESEVGSSTHFILVAGHSSGSFVADELLQQLATGADPKGVTADKMVYFDLDGDQKYVSGAGIARLRKAYYVGAHDVAKGTLSPNHAVMQSLGSTYASSGGFFEYDASSAGCNAGATWCVHVSLITTRPHNPADADAIADYSDFVGRPVNHFWIDSKANAAGLQP